MFTVENEYGKLEAVLLCPPDYFSIDEPINVLAQKYHLEGVNLERARRQHNSFVEALRQEGVEVVLAETDPHSRYQLNTRDLGVATRKGILFGRFLLPARWGEHRLAERTFAREGIPLFHQIPAGTFEGGDFVYLDEKRAAVGTGIRTDALGIKCLEVALHDTGLQLRPVDFEAEYLHLDMLLNVPAPKTAVACREALPGDFLEELEREGFCIVDISPAETLDHGTNFLPVGGGTIISHTKIPRINGELRKLGLRVIELELEELQKSGGGPRCMSFPLRRRRE
jgi:N-dimethylarginine dimethylaminohydrolase